MAKMVESNFFCNAKKNGRSEKTRIYFSRATQTRWCHYLYNRTFINRKVCENQGKYILGTQRNRVEQQSWTYAAFQPNINLTVKQLQLLKLQLLGNRLSNIYDFRSEQRIFAYIFYCNVVNENLKLPDNARY